MRRWTKTIGLLPLLAALFWSGAVQSAEVRDCETFEANARNVNWDDPTRSFANGAIRLIALDTEEPVCCSAHLMVLYQDPEDPFLACRLVSQAEGLGWLRMSLSTATARYDAARGLTVSLPVGLYGEAGGSDAIVEITINQSTGAVTVQ